MLKVRPIIYSALCLSLLLAPATRAAIITTFEAPGVQTSSALDASTIDFDSAGLNYHYQQVFTPSGSLTATYDGNQFIREANEYGGAGGAGQFIAVQQGNSMTLTLSTAQAYFGLWLSAADNFNRLEFYSGNMLLRSFSAVGPEMSALPGAYLGNPSVPFQGDNSTEKYAFVNFYSQAAGDMFDKIVFTNLEGGGTEFESDNHTFSATLQAPAVPEPSSMSSIGIAMLVLSGRWMHKRRKDSASV